MRKLILHFANDDTGATAIEYGLIAAGIARMYCRVSALPARKRTHSRGEIDHRDAGRRHWRG